MEKFEMEENLTPEQKELDKSIKYLEKQGYTVEDIKQFVAGLQSQASKPREPYKVGKSHVRIGLSGDYHLGHNLFDVELFNWYLRETKKEKVDFHINGGDIFDGWYQNRPSSIFEQNAVGFDNQMKLGVKYLSQLEAPLYFITGNHSYNTFVRGAGVEAGPVLEDKLTMKGVESHYLGNGEGDMTLKNGTKIKILHPDGGTAYALSYRPQKIIESLTGGEKPDLLTIHHFHKLEQLFYRNIHAYQAGTFLGQTKFMRGKNIAAHKGFWILDVFGKTGGGIDKVVSRLYTAYD